MKYDFTSIIDRKGKDALAVDISLAVRTELSALQMKYRAFSKTQKTQMVL